MSYLDTRVQYTKTKIQDCFIHILNKKPVDKITVKEVCDMAKINRSTFYFHYANCFNLFDEIKQEAFENLLLFVKEIKVGNLYDMFNKLLLNIKENYLYYSAIAARDKNFMAQMIDICFQQAGNPDIFGLINKSEISKKKYYYYFVAYGCSGILINWISNGMEENISDVSKLLEKLVRHNLINSIPNARLDY